MRHGSLFSGIGGFDLAAEWMGWENVFHCEWNEFGKKVLNYYWPNAISYHDITKTDFTIHRGNIDILTGGFPCQPYSAAGKRKGKEDDRHLWPEMLRAIREIQPRWVVGENVLGLVNWNGGLVFNEVQADLEAEGYEVQPFILPAASVNAPHRRDRVWFVAHRNSARLQEKRAQQQATGIEQYGKLDGTTQNTNGSGWDGIERKEESCEREQWDISAGNNERISTNDDETWITPNTDSRREGGLRNESKKTGTQESDQPFGSICGISPTTDTSQQQLQRSQQYGSIESPWEIEGQSRQPSRSVPSNWQEFPTQSPVLSRNDGISERLDLTAISFPKWRNESIKAAGNAIVPQVAFQIFKAIELTTINHD
jgi:DNA (cytosine-5)-methyltransferase 1